MLLGDAKKLQGYFVALQIARNLIDLDETTTKLHESLEELTNSIEFLMDPDRVEDIEEVEKTQELLGDAFMVIDDTEYSNTPGMTYRR